MADLGVILEAGPGLVTPQPIGPPTVGGLVCGPGAFLLGWALAELTGVAAAALTIFDGDSAAGFAAIPINLAAGQSVRDWLGPQGVWMRRGVTTVVASGSIGGVLFIAAANLGGGT